MRCGIVYVMVNEGLPGARKIGRTFRTADRRAAELTRAYGTPYDFVVESKHVVDNPHAVEALAHRLLRKHRVKNTEIFYVSAKLASSTVKTAAMMTLHRPLWLRIWHWIILPKARADSPNKGRARGHNVEAFWVMMVGLALTVFVAYEKPKLPNWLPEPALRAAIFIERLTQPRT